MATINISEIRPTGSNLFSDFESYMNELVDSELDSISGGGIVPPPTCDTRNMISLEIFRLPPALCAYSVGVA